MTYTEKESLLLDLLSHRKPNHRKCLDGSVHNVTWWVDCGHVVLEVTLPRLFEVSDTSLYANCEVSPEVASFRSCNFLSQAFPLRFCILQAIKNWRQEWPGNKATSNYTCSLWVSCPTPSCLPDVMRVTLSPRPFPPPVFDHLQYAKTEGEDLGEGVTCVTSGRHEWGLGMRLRGSQGSWECSLVPRLFPPPVFDHLQYGGEEGLKERAPIMSTLNGPTHIYLTSCTWLLLPDRSRLCFCIVQKRRRERPENKATPDEQLVIPNN